MSRPTPLLAIAAVVAVGLGGALAPAAHASPALSARAATAQALRVSTPCSAGRGTIVLRAHATATGGTALRARVTGNPHHRWGGLMMVGSDLRNADGTRLEDEDSGSAESGRTLRLRPPAAALGRLARTGDGTVTSHNGVVTASFSSKKTWPRVVGAMLAPSRGAAFCTAFAVVGPNRLLAVSESSGALLRRSHHVVRAFAMGGPDSRWRVRVTLQGHGVTRQLWRTARADHGGAVDVGWKGVQRLGQVNRVVMKATNLADGHVRTMTIRRFR